MSIAKGAFQKLSSDERGFTLTEMTVVLVLMGGLISIMYLVLNTTTSWANRGDARSVAAREARLTVDSLTKDLRQAEELESGKGVFLTAGQSECVFYADLNHDNVPEKVTYYVDGDRVRRKVAEATIDAFPWDFGPDGEPTTLIGKLEAGRTNIFAYMDTTGASAATIAEVSAVRVRLRNQATVGAETAYADTRTIVKIRSVHNSITLLPIEGGLSWATDASL